MAHVVAAYGLSHGPLLTTPPDQWHQRAAYDERHTRHAYRGTYYDYPGLRRARERDFTDQIDLATKTRRYEACQRAIAEIARRYAASGANAAIILGNDHSEVFGADVAPAYLVYAGETIETVFPDEEEYRALDAAGLAVALPGHVPPEGATYPGARDLAERLVDGLVEREFDVALSYKLPGNGSRRHGMPHAFGFIFRRIMQDRPPPTVPFFSNVTETRNQPRLARMLKLGHALKRTLDALPDSLNVALFSSGGFSHFTVDEAFDRTVLDAMLRGDEAALAAQPEAWFGGNTGEIKSWYPMVAAMNDYGRKMELLDYVPCYRSAAGTGQAMTFAAWN